MPRTFWTLENAGIEKALANSGSLPNWGIDDLTASFINQAEDVVELSLGGRRYDAAYLFAFKSQVIIRRDRVAATDGSFSGGSQYFAGLVTRPHASASGRSESQGCAIVGPWWYLNERGFEQEYREFAGWIDGDPANGAQYNVKTSNRIFLNQSRPHPDGSGLAKITTGAQLAEILTWALKPFVDASAPPPFQIGSITLAVDPPIDEVKNITCAEAARKMFRWSPDAVAWFDYTTSPPTFHAKRRAELAAFNHDLSAVKPESISVTPRPDLQRPFVKIIYEIINSVDGGDRLELLVDVYPDPIPSGALNQYGGVPFVVDLRGFTRTSASAGLTTEVISAADESWWQNRLKELKAASITKFVVDAKHRDAPATVPSSIKFSDGIQTLTLAEFTALNLPRAVIGGTPTEWMGKNFRAFNVTCEARVEHSAGRKTAERSLNTTVLATDATTGTYSSSNVTTGDPIPVGLAQAFHEAVRVLPYEGSVRFHHAEVGGLARVGNKLNFTNGHADWVTMNALVQRVSETIFSGATEIEYGAPAHLNLDDLISLFFVTRNRQITQPIRLRSGASLAGNIFALSPHTALNNSASAPGNEEVGVYSGSPTPATEADPAKQGVITHDGPAKRSEWTGGPNYGSAQIAVGKAGEANTNQGRDIRFREWDVCVVVDGVRVNKKALFWSSLPY